MTMEMSVEAQRALDIISKTNANLFLTGKAGTGKTTFLKELRRLSPKRMVVLAPTGIAAINAEGQTIHSFFQLPLSPYIPGATVNRDDKSRFFKFSKIKRNIIRTLDLLVIDEISMVRSDLLDAVDDVMRRYRRFNEPFGGVQLLMIGDLQQLAPVTTGEEEVLLKQYYDTPYFFSSRALQQAGYLTIELQKVYRQQDDRFVRLLNDVRCCNATDKTLQELNSRYIPGFVPDKKDSYIRLTTHNRPAQLINEQELEKIDAPAFSFDANIIGTFPEYAYPTENRLVLKRGAQIMFVKNDAQQRYYNGMIGEVVDITDSEITVKSRDTGETFALEMAEWTNSKYTLNAKTNEIEETVEGTFAQYPVRLAWAITIHKSQGLTFEHAIIDASRSFTHGQTYVALSRCKSLEGMVLSAPLSHSAIIRDNIVDTFTSSMEPPSQETVSEMERQFIVKCIDELFDFKPMRQFCESLKRTMIEYFSSKYPKLVAEYRQTDVVFANLVKVAETFRQQYTRMLYAAGGDVSNAALQERIRKGAMYYYDKNAIFRNLVNATNVQTENKTAKKLYQERLEALKEEVRVKDALLRRYMTGNAFSVSDYLNKRAAFLLGQEEKDAETGRQTQKAQTEKVRKPKEEKTPTRMITLDMYRRNMKPGEIAKTRGLAVSTIMSHLAACVIEGDIDIRDFVSEKHEAALRRFLADHEDMTFSEIREAVGEQYSYTEIKVVKGLMDRDQ